MLIKCRLLWWIQMDFEDQFDDWENEKKTLPMRCLTVRTNAHAMCNMHIAIVMATKTHIYRIASLSKWKNTRLINNQNRRLSEQAGGRAVGSTYTISICSERWLKITMTISDAFTNHFQTFCHGGDEVGVAVAAKKHEMTTYTSTRLPNWIILN